MEIILLLIAAAAGTIIFLASRKPDVFAVSRTALINAPVDVVFDHVNDLEKWQTWSPWARMDPNAVGNFESTNRSGKGARLSWKGKKTGKGSMTMTESRPMTYVEYRLEFIKPMKATNTASFTLAPEGQNARVTWAMPGDNSFAGKIFSVFVNCEKMCGDQFDQGLANLNEVVTGRPGKAA